MLIAAFVLWFSVLMIVYPYLLYPAIVWLLGTLRPRPVRRSAYRPTVTVLIPAFNERDCIAATIENKLEQDYPSDLLRILVVSDGSTDGTDDVVRQYANRRVELMRREPRQGKAAGLNAAVKAVTSDIIVFSDANSIFDQTAISRMVENFADSSVGYVTGKLAFVTSSGGVTGNNSYMKYENLVRLLETRAFSIIGVNGGVDAIRRELYVDIPRELITDFILPLDVIGAGFRVVYDDRVKACEVANKETASEFRMRVRVALRAMQGLRYMRKLLNIFRFPAASFSIISHKVLRYGAFVFMPVALAANAVLVREPFYLGLLVAQILVYVLALVGLQKDLPRILRALTVVPTYFVLSNIAFALATVKFIRGESMATWQPRAG